MTVGGVGSGKGVSAPLPAAGVPGAAEGPAGSPAAEADAGASPDALAVSAQGTASLIGADGKVRVGWGLVDAPPVLPTDPGKLIEMKKYGDMEVPEPRPDIESPPITSAEIIKPPVDGAPTPIRKNKFSIVTGPPQGDP